MQRFMRTIIVLIISLGCLLSSLSSFAGSPAITDSLAPMLQKALPAIVNIRAQIKVTDFNMLNKLQQRKKGNQQQNNDDEPMPDKMLSVGSGVIVDANKGYIITNAHVVDEAQTVIVTLSDAHRYTAKIIGMDRPSDIALLQIQAKNLTAIPISDSNNLKVGDFVAAIGNPFGLSQTVTSGIVSALGRTTLGFESFENFIQTDAPINPGNSGGALINTQGQLIGINTAILSPDRGSIGIGFAIPSNMAKSVMQQLIQFGDVKRGALGIGAQDITPDLATALNLNTTKGAAVTEIIPNSSAESAGFEVGDIITAVNDNEVKNANDLINGIAFLRVDSKANIRLLRNNKTKTITATLTDPNKRREIGKSLNPFLFGVGLKDFSALIPGHGNVQGVAIVTIEEDSNAWQADLRPGDIIVATNSNGKKQKINSIADLTKIANSAKDSLVLNVLRGPGAVFLVINREEA